MALSIEEHEDLVKMHAEKRLNNKALTDEDIEDEEWGIEREVKRIENRKNNFRTRDKYWVYFIQWVQGGPIKIGKAKKVSSRVASHQVSSPYELKILAMVEAHNFELEQKILTHFDEHRMRGEWFEPHEDIINFIKLVKNREFKKFYSILGCEQYARRNEECVSNRELELDKSHKGWRPTPRIRQGI